MLLLIGFEKSFLQNELSFDVGNGVKALEL